MKTTLQVFALSIVVAFTLYVPVAAMAQDDNVAELDAAAAATAADTPTPAAADALPAPVEGEPTTIGAGIEKGAQSYKAFKDGNLLAGVVATLLLLVWMIRSGLKLANVKLGKTATYVLVFVVAFMQQAALDWQGVTAFSWTMIPVVLVSVLASGKAFDLSKAGVEKLKAGA